MNKNIDFMIIRFRDFGKKMSCFKILKINNKIKKKYK